MLKIEKKTNIRNHIQTLKWWTKSTIRRFKKKKTPIRQRAEHAILVLVILYPMLWLDDTPKFVYYASLILLYPHRLIIKTKVMFVCYYKIVRVVFLLFFYKNLKYRKQLYWFLKNNKTETTLLVVIGLAGFILSLA